MNFSYGPRGILQIDDARIVYRNFSGTGSKFNREGDRNFSVIIPNQDIADALLEQGWNVKIRPPRDEDDTPFMHLPVKIKFSDRGPNIQLKTGGTINYLDEETIDCLDNIDIASVNLDLRPYDWEVNGKAGRTAYLQGICVIQEIDRFSRDYNEEV